MPEVTFTESDLLSSKELQASWYTCKVLDITSKPGKNNPESTTYYVELLGMEGEANGVQIRHILSDSGAMGKQKLAEYVKSFLPEGQKLAAGVTFPLEATIDKMVRAYIYYENGDYPGNKVKNFRRA